jgi:hypothetical protein
MDKELKEKWVEALRSGRYVQGEVHFERGDKFCCLGVLCEVLGEPTTIVVNGYPASNYPAIEPVLGVETYNILYEMNDGVCGRAKHSFAEIADYIEANL